MELDDVAPLPAGRCLRPGSRVMGSVARPRVTFLQGFQALSYPESDQDPTLLTRLTPGPRSSETFRDAPVRTRQCCSQRD